VHLQKKHKIIIPDDEIKKILERKVSGKPHIADAVYKYGLTTLSREEFFKKCLDDMDTRSFKLAAERVIEAVHNAGGFVSFAHPNEFIREHRVSLKALDLFVKQLKEQGLDCIEAYYSTHSITNIKNYKAIAKKYKLKLTAGSDFHKKGNRAKIGKISKDDLIIDYDEIIRGLPL